MRGQLGKLQRRRPLDPRGAPRYRTNRNADVECDCERERPAERDRDGDCRTVEQRVRRADRDRCPERIADGDTDGNADGDTDGNADGDTDGGGDGNTDTDRDADERADSDSYSRSDRDADAYGDANVQADSLANRNADGHTHRDSDGHPDRDSHRHAHGDPDGGSYGHADERGMPHVSDVARDRDDADPPCGRNDRAADLRRRHRNRDHVGALIGLRIAGHDRRQQPELRQRCEHLEQSGGTPILYTSLAVSQSVTFTTPSIATVVTSQCLILPNHTYNVGLYVFGSPAGSQYGATNVVPNGHTISFSIGVPLGGTFPSGATGDVVISQN